MLSKRNRSTKLWLEGLEARAVPAVLEGTEPPPTETVVVTTTEEPKPEEVGGIDGELTPDEIFQTATGGSTALATDLGVTLTSSKSAPGLGDVITLSVNLKNAGEALSSSAGVKVTLPVGLSLVKALPPTGTTYDSTTGVWNASILGPTESQTLKIQAKVTETAAMDVGVAIDSAGQADGNTANNSATSTIAPVLGALQLTQASSTVKPTVGSTIVFTATVKNTGAGNGQNVVVTEAFSAGLANIRVVSASQGKYDAASKTWTVGALKAGQTATMRIVAQVTKTGEATADAALTALGIDADKSVLAATAKTTGTRDNTLANWTYLSGPNFQTSSGPKGTIPPLMAFKKPVAASVPYVPTLPPALNTLAIQSAIKALIAKGFVFKAPEGM